MKGITELELKEYTYKELCQVLGEESKTNRQKQYRRWSRYFEFEQIGQKFRIVEIYENPIVDDISAGNNSTYINYFKDIIINILTESDVEYATVREWLLRIKLVNENLFGDYKVLGKQLSCYIATFETYYVQNCQTDIERFVGYQ